MIYYKADENNMVTIFTKSAQSAKDYHLTEICADDGLETAWDGSVWVKGYAPEKPEKEVNKQKIAQLKAQLNGYDLQSIRPLRAKEAGVATQEDLDKLAELEEQAEVVREQIKQLGE